MKPRFRPTFILVLAAVIVALAGRFPVFAQSFPTGQTAADNTRGGSVRNRQPGNLVSEGVVRALDFGDRGRVGTIITDTTRPTSIRNQIIADSLEVVFQQLNSAILAFHNLLLARAGQSPILSTSGTPSTLSRGRR